PMLTFTPLFMLLTSPIILGEVPSWTGICGILFIVIGAYLLNIREKHKGYLAPFRALTRERGPRLMLIVALIWSITSNFDKVGVQSSSPYFWTITVSAYIMVGMIPLVYSKLRKIGLRKLMSFKFVILMGLFFSLSMICQMTAVNLTLVAYIIAIKRSSALMGVLWGHFIFKEKDMGERLVGAIIMLAGVIIISIT
nr:EamA family transporter [Bacteroidota bacterium]